MRTPKIEIQPTFSADNSLPSYGRWHHQYVYRLPNDHGLSVVQGSGLYCTGRGDVPEPDDYEVALIAWEPGAEDKEFEIIYRDDTLFGNDVLGWQTDDQIAALLLLAGSL